MVSFDSGRRNTTRRPTDRRNTLASSTAPSYVRAPMVTAESSENSEAGSRVPSAMRWVLAPFGTATPTVRRTSTRPSL